MINGIEHVYYSNPFCYFKEVKISLFKTSMIFKMKLLEYKNLILVDFVSISLKEIQCVLEMLLNPSCIDPLPLDRIICMNGLQVVVEDKKLLAL